MTETSQAEYEAFFTQAVQPGPKRLASGFTFAAINIDGTKSVHKTYGTTNIKDATELKPDALYWVASMTKLITSVSALQCVERGILDLDDPQCVSRLLPEFEQLQVLKSANVDTKEVILEPLATPITLRMLLTHTSGFNYDSISPNLMAWRSIRGETPQWMCGKLHQAYLTPLVSQPGTAYNYGPSIDWAGEMVARANKTSLGQYFQKNIFNVLGMHESFFDEQNHISSLSKLVPPVRRGAEGGLEDGQLPFLQVKEPGFQDDLGGVGLHSTTSDYLLFLRAILTRDERILKGTSYDLMSKGCLSEQVRPSLFAYINNPIIRPMLLSGFPDDLSVWNHSLACMTVEETVPGLANAGSMAWAGVTNPFWIVDPEAKYCAVFMQNLQPVGDVATDVLRRKVREYLFQEFSGYSN